MQKPILISAKKVYKFIKLIEIVIFTHYIKIKSFLIHKRYHGGFNVNNCWKSVLPVIYHTTEIAYMYTKRITTCSFTNAQ